MDDFKWFDIIENSSQIEQGDIITNCPIIIPPKDIATNNEPEIDVKLIDSIILSQSCDLENNKIQIVLVCPYFTLNDFIERLEGVRNKKQKDKVIDNLKKGYQTGYHLLEKPEEVIQRDYIVVDFRNVYGIQIESLREIANKLERRLRLLPPYKEHLSQAFARYFMRVGLPQNIKVEGY